MPATDQRQMENQDENRSGSMDLNEQTSAGRNEDSNERGAKRGTANRGFAAMNPEKQKSIASEGGRAAHQQGVAHEWSSDEAREAGRKGGQTVSRNREHMSEIGRRGGQSSGSKRSTQRNDSGRTE